MKKIEGFPISILRNKSEVEKLGFNTKDILEILIETGKGIENLHDKANIFIGDLNGRNILFDKNKKVYFLDFDGMGVDDITPEFFTDGYVDPESKNNKCITMKDDWYSFAIQAFYYLTYTHPFNGIYEQDKTLDIVEKMERKISLLGNHGMTPPKVALSWDYMDNELKKVFLNTFEGDFRQSIVPFLLRQYNQLNSNDDCEENCQDKTTNNKFKVSEINPFGIEPCNIITNKAYFSYNGLAIAGNEYLSIYTINAYKLNRIKDVILSDDGELVFVIYKNEVRVYLLANNKKIFNSKIINMQNFDINDNVLYYSATENGENVIYKKEFLEDDTTKSTTIKFKTDMITKAFSVKDNSKFIVVKTNLDGNDIIYCNDLEYYIIPKDYTAEEYNILYDNKTEKWLIIGNNGLCILISLDMKNEVLEEEKIIGCNTYNIVFNNGIIYVPLNGGLYIYNTKSEVEKEISCDIDINSKIYINADGFSFIKNKKLYKYSLN